ncbi:3'-5' exonuclease domain-containing protein 2 [bacterium]|nr:3'-5' exonuclease domain-containing protein 2 [bacterium]
MDNPTPSAPPPPLPAGLTRRISREDLAALPLRRYTGKIILVTDAAGLEQARRDLHDERVVGFDTEKRPSFRKGQSYPPSLVQFATAQAVYLLPVRESSVHRLVAQVLAARHSVKTGVALDRDAQELQALVSFTPHHLVDLGAIAQRCGIEQSGARNLAGLFLGFRVSKGARTTNWSRPQLTPAQITYAATDAWVGRELYLRFAALGLVNHAARPAATS